ncbi:MAG TPA: VWA domain-containing protein [Pyrinomonadaceae bacterium]|nr:VWA domain-containing protein [Pyrinomonadaceae bacterium]
MRPNKTLVYLLLLAALSLVNLFPSRIATLQQADANTYNEQGLALMASEKFDEAVVAFSQAVKLKPDYAAAHCNLGDAYFELEEVKKAIEAYKQAIRYRPDFALAYNKLGTAYREQRDYKKAVEAYNQSLRLDPNASLTHYNLGLVYANRENVKAAAGEYNTLQKLDPNLAQDLYNVIYKPTTSVVTDGKVRLNVMALDSRGVPVSGLKSENFQVLEEGASQTVSLASTGPASVFYGIVIDTSGSLRSVLPLAIATSKQIVEKMLPADQAMLVRFISSDKIEVVQEFTPSKRRLNGGIDSLFVEGGQSAVLDAVYLAAQHTAGYKFPDRNARRVLWLLTDGDDRASYYKLEQLLALLRSVDVQVFVISFSPNADRSEQMNENQPKQAADLLRTLAAETGGAAFFPRSAAELGPTVNLIFDLIRAEYTIEYKPTKPVAAGIYRPVTVTFVPTPQRQQLGVVSRHGYLLTVK